MQTSTQCAHRLHWKAGKSASFLWQISLHTTHGITEVTPLFTSNPCVSCTSFSTHSLLHTSSTQKRPCSGDDSQFPAAQITDSWKWQSKVRSCCHPLNSACECPLLAPSLQWCSVCWAQACSLSKAMSQLCLEPSSSEDDSSSSGGQGFPCKYVFSESKQVKKLPVSVQSNLALWFPWKTTC